MDKPLALKSAPIILQNGANCTLAATETQSTAPTEVHGGGIQGAKKPNQVGNSSQLRTTIWKEKGMEL